MRQYNLKFFTGVGSHEKYNRNIIYSKLNQNFMKQLLTFADSTDCKDIFEVGCGEGHLLGILYQNGFKVSGFDMDNKSIEVAKANFRSKNMSIEVNVNNIYEFTNESDNSYPSPIFQRHPLVICCEVLEHLEEPNKALKILKNLAADYIIISVPHEPWWRLLNLMRGKYWKLKEGGPGNTPGHINHWTKRSILKLLSTEFEVVDIKTPLPWIMILCKVSHRL